MSDYSYPEQPRIAVGAVVIHQNRVLLVQRGNAPAKGEWAIPGGKVELGETLRHAVEREIFEETGIKIRAGEIIYTFESIHRDQNGQVKFHYVILDYSAEYLSGNPVPQDDVWAAAWVSGQDAQTLNINPNTLSLLKKIKFLV